MNQEIIPWSSPYITVRENSIVSSRGKSTTGFTTYFPANQNIHSILRWLYNRGLARSWDFVTTIEFELIETADKGRGVVTNIIML
jgi:hypothetical protein